MRHDEALVQVVPPAWLRLFSTQEVAQLLSGGDAGAVSVADLRQHTVYSGGFSARSSTVTAFWKVTGASSHVLPVLSRVPPSVVT